MIKLIFSEAVEARLLNDQDLYVDKNNPSFTKKTHKTLKNVIYAKCFFYHDPAILSEDFI